MNKYLAQDLADDISEEKIWSWIISLKHLSGKQETNPKSF